MEERTPRSVAQEKTRLGLTLLSPTQSEIDAHLTMARDEACALAARNGVFVDECELVCGMGFWAKLMKDGKLVQMAFSPGVLVETETDVCREMRGS